MRLFKNLKDRGPAAAIRALFRLKPSLRSFLKNRQISSFGWPATVSYDHLGVPSIKGRTRADALRALGYVTACDRFFQMDLLRRQAAGTLSEIFGNRWLRLDSAKRVLGFNRVPSQVLSALPDEQRAALDAYAEGVNAWLGQMRVPPFEYLAMGCRPQSWQAGDSVLVALTMFEELCFDYESERMMTVMEECLPPDVVRFLTPDTDCYATVLTGGDRSRRPAQPIPVESLAKLVPRGDASSGPACRIVATAPIKGSSAWAISRLKTADGRAIIANDIHLRLSVPNIFYRASLSYHDARISGIVVPGLPAILAGSNGEVAWGITNLFADCLDLVLLNVDPHTGEYETPQGWKQFERVTETIFVRGGRTYEMEVRTTIWGPVVDTDFMGRQVALHATALDPRAIDFGIIGMDRARNLEDAMAVVNNFAGPSLSVTLADSSGRIGWTTCGKLPLRTGFDGTAARSWADGSVGWETYIPASELPRVLDPPEGYLATANNRVVGADYPNVIGTNFGNSYRAHRISQQLRNVTVTDEKGMSELQLDTVAGFYEFYRELALEALSDERVQDCPNLLDIRTAIAAWDGKAHTDSVGIAILVLFRDLLADAVVSPFLESCRKADDKFTYRWFNMESPLRSLLTEKPHQIVPDPDRHENWNGLVVSVLEESARQIKTASGCRSHARTTWGEINKLSIQHPLAAVQSGLNWLLDMPRRPVAGCKHCICVSEPGYGAVMRMIVSPGHHGDGFFSMPCGQSGHPLSGHYDDYQQHWRQGSLLPFSPDWC